MENTDIQDEELMARAGKGDDEAFRILVQRHQGLVYGTVSRMLGQQNADAEDVSQQVFIRVYKAASRYRPTAKFTTWLLTICRNCVFTHAKSRSKWKMEPLEYETDEGISESPHPDTVTLNAGDQIQHQELEEALQKALKSLPENQRMALILRQFEQMDYEQIAQVVETSVPSVKSLLFRARETMRIALQKYLE